MRVMSGVVAALILWAFPVMADEVVLKNGMTIHDPISSRSDQWVKLDVGGVTVTYYTDEIKSINGVAPALPPAPVAAPVAHNDVDAVLPPQQTQDAVPAAVSQPPVDQVVSDTPLAATAVPPAPVFKSQTSTAPMATMPSTNFSATPSTNIPITMGGSGSMKNTPMNPAAALMVIGFMLVLFVIMYAVFVYPLYLIAKKQGVGNPVFAFIPLLNLYLMVQIAGRPVWWLLLLFVPFLNIIINVMLWMDIAAARKKPAWMGFLILVPLANIGMIWYLALSDS